MAVTCPLSALKKSKRSIYKMRIKIIQRFLSMMIAAATVLTIPGVAGAVKSYGGGNKKTTKKSSNCSLKVPQFVDDEEEEDVNLKSNVATVAEPEKKKQPLNSFVGLFNFSDSRMDAMLHAALKDENEKINFVSVINCFYKFKNLASWIEMNADDILSTLLHCSLSEKFRKDVLEIISNLFKEEHFKDWSDSKIIKLLKDFIQYKNNDISQSVILEIIRNLSLLGHFKDLNAIDMLEMLYKAFCLGCDRKIMTAAVRTWAENGCFKNCSSDSIFNVICLLNRCLCENQVEDDVIINIAYTMKCLAHVKYFKEIDEHQANSIVEFLSRCAKYDFVRDLVADVAKRLSNSENFKSCSSKLATVLGLRCANFEKLNVAQKANQNIIRIDLLKSAIVEEGSMYQNLNQNEIARGSDTAQMEEEFMYQNENQNEIAWGPDACKAQMEEEFMYQNENQNEIIIDLSSPKGKKKVKNKLTNSNNIKSRANVTNKKLKKCTKKIVKNIKNLVNMDWLKQGNDGISLNDKISRMINIFIACCDHDKAKEYIVDIIGYTVDDDLLKNSSKQQIKDILYILNNCADYVGTKKSVVMDICKLAEKNLFHDFSNADLENIQNVLKKCLDGPDGEVLVAGAIATLAKKGLAV